MLHKLKLAFNDPLANVAKVAVVFAGLIAFAIYMSNATTAQDWYWFQSGFDELPTRIILYRQGAQVELAAGEAGFEALAEAVRASLSSGVQSNSHTGLSDVSLHEAYTRYVTVEAFFARPVKLHAWFFTGAPTRMLFPVTGRHAERAIVFLGDGAGYRADAPILKSKAPLLEALHSLGYLP